MDRIAIALSLLAIVVAILSAHYARRQAQTAEQLADIERERRRDEVEDRTAQATADMRVALRDGQHDLSRLSFRNLGPGAATEVRLEYLDANDGKPPPDTTSWKDISASIREGWTESQEFRSGPHTSRDFQVALYWEDGRGQQRQEFHLHYPKAEPTTFRLP